MPTSSPELKTHSRPLDGFLAGGSIPGGTNTDTGPHLQAAAGPRHPLPGRHSPNTAVTVPGAPQAPVPAPVPSRHRSATAGPPQPAGTAWFPLWPHHGCIARTFAREFYPKLFFFFFKSPFIQVVSRQEKKKKTGIKPRLMFLPEFLLVLRKKKKKESLNCRSKAFNPT